MGGNYFLKHNIETDRCSTNQLYEYSKEILNIIEPLISNSIYKTFIPNFVDEKETHGDIDIIFLTSDITTGFMKEIIKENFDYTDVSINKDTITFDYKNVQVDIIIAVQEVTNETFELVKFCYSYDPLNMLMNKILRNFAVKINSKGIFYIYGCKERSTTDEIFLSNDIKYVFKLLELDINDYYNGFKTFKQIYDYIISCKYFEHDKFLLENLTNKARKRALKRKKYIDFLNYIEKNNINSTYSFKHISLYKDYVYEIFKQEVDLYKKIEYIDKMHENIQIVKDKFKYKDVVDLFPNMNKAEIGHMVREFKLYNKEFIYNNPKEDILKLFKKIYL